MSYRMIYTLQRLMCDKFSILCTMAELNAKQMKEDERVEPTVVFDEKEQLFRYLKPEDFKTEAERMKLNVKIKRLSEDAVIPKYAREMDAGVDLIAIKDVIIEPGETKLIPTGIAISLPPGFEAQVRPRSGITLKSKIRVQLGTIDGGYVGEIGVIADNIAQRNHHTGNNAKTIDGGHVQLTGLTRLIDTNAYIIRKGDRVAQLVIAPVENAKFTEVDELGATERGAGGFGHTGVNGQ